MNEKQDPFSAMMASRFLPERKGPTLQGLLLAALVVALVVPGLYLALEPGSAVEGQSSRCPTEVPEEGERPAPLEVCLASVELLESSRGVEVGAKGVEVGAKVEVNREILPWRTKVPMDNEDQWACEDLGENYVPGECRDTLAMDAEPEKLNSCETKPCIRGGILVRDSYFDPIHSSAGTGTIVELIAFAIRSGETLVAHEDLTYYVCDDGIDNPDRTVGIEINPVFVPEDGYDINDRYSIQTIKIAENQDKGGEP